MTFLKTKAVTALVGTMLFLNAACKKNSGDPSGIIIDHINAEKAKEAAKTIVAPITLKDTTFGFLKGNITYMTYDSIKIRKQFYTDSIYSIAIYSGKSHDQYRIYNAPDNLFINTDADGNFFSKGRVHSLHSEARTDQREVYASQKDDRFVLKLPTHQFAGNSGTIVLRPNEKNGQVDAPITVLWQGQDMDYPTKAPTTPQGRADLINKNLTAINGRPIYNGF